MSNPMLYLTTTTLGQLATALEGGALTPPFSVTAVGRYVGAPSAGAVTAVLNDLDQSGRSVAFGRMLRLIIDERQLTQKAHERIELVWSGPEVPGAISRDTSVVVNELFAGAERSVLVSTYAIHQGAAIFEGLACAMDAKPSLSVRLFLNVDRPRFDATPEDEILRVFVETFRSRHWPGRRLPEVYYDPRALAEGAGSRAALHAKCIVVDDAKAFVTSANFTEAAQERNIEAGILVEDAAFAETLRLQFDLLLSAGLLRRMPL